MPDLLIDIAAWAIVAILIVVFVLLPAVLGRKER